MTFTFLTDQMSSQATCLFTFPSVRWNECSLWIRKERILVPVVAFFAWPWASHFILLSLSCASWLEDKKTSGCLIGLMWKFSCWTHIRRLLHGPGCKVDTWHFCKNVKRKAIIFRKVVYCFLPVCQGASLWAVRLRSKQAAYQSVACVGGAWRETVPFRWEGSLSSWPSHWS